MKGSTHTKRRPAHRLEHDAIRDACMEASSFKSRTPSKAFMRALIAHYKTKGVRMRIRKVRGLFTVSTRQLGGKP